MSETTAEIPTRIQVDPLVGYKTLNLRLDAGRVLLAGMRRSYSGLLETAECVKYPKNEAEHSTPGLDCTCGFYAWREQSEVGPSGHLASVELFGSVVVCEKGFRAAKQRVTSLLLAPGCDQCRSLGDSRRIADAVYFSMPGNPFLLCADHGALAERLNAALRLSVEEISDRLSIPVGWRS